jgi:hypothetical protein
MNFENIMPSERSQTQQNRYILFHLYEIPRKEKFIEPESKRDISGPGKTEKGIVFKWVQNLCLEG